MYRILTLKIVTFSAICLAVSSVTSAQAPAAPNAAVDAGTIVFPIKVQEPAQKIHLIVASLTADPSGKIDKGTQANRDFIKSLFDRELENAQAWKGAVRILDYSQFTPTTIAAEIQQLPSGPKDTVVCYISTHGAFDPSRGHYMATAQGNLYRSTLMTQLKQKNARLTVLLTDSCAVKIPTTAAKPVQTAELPSHAIFDLLFYYQGTVDINGSSGPSAANPNGQYSWYWNQADVQGGGFFTRAFCNSAVFAPNGDWQAFFTDVGTRLRVQEPPEPQDPMWFDN